MENENFEIEKTKNRIFVESLDLGRTKRIYIALEKLSVSAVEFLQSGKLKEFSFAADKMRPLLSYIADNNVKFSQHLDTEDNLKDDENIKSVAKTLNKNLQIIRAALETMGQVPFNPVFFTSEELTNAFLDYQIPLAWEFDFDLIVAMNLENRKLVETLVERGQKRIFLIGGSLNAESFADEFPNDVNIFQFDDYKKLSDVMGVFAHRPVRRVTVIDSGNTKTDVDILNEIKELAKQGRMSAWMLFNTINRGDAVKVLDNLNNVTENQKTSDFHEKFAGRSAVIVCPGPSLAKNIHLLKKLEGKAIIICVLHALKALRKANIVPDMVIHTDPQNLKKLKSGDEEGDPSLWDKWVSDEDFTGVKYFVTSGSVSPEMFRIPADNILWMSAGIAIGSALPFDVHDYNRVGGSVSHSAFDLAVEFGCSSIVLVGQDLAFSEEGVLYSSGSELNKEQDKKLNLGEVFDTDGLNGTKVKTNSAYDFFAKKYTEFAKGLEGRGINLYNCTEGGRFIEGFEHIKLQDFIEQEVSLKTGKHIDQIFEENQRDVETLKSDKKKMRQFINKNIMMNQEVDKLIGQAAEIARKNNHTDHELSKFDLVQNKTIKKMKKNYFYELGLQKELYILGSGLQADRSLDGQLAFHLDFLNSAKLFNNKLKKAFNKQFNLISRH